MQAMSLFWSVRERGWQERWPTGLLCAAIGLPLFWQLGVPAEWMFAGGAYRFAGKGFMLLGGLFVLFPFRTTIAQWLTGALAACAWARIAVVLEVHRTGTLFEPAWMDLWRSIRRGDTLDMTPLVGLAVTASLCLIAATIARSVLLNQSELSRAR
jgi:hypothetical protein